MMHLPHLIQSKIISETSDKPNSTSLLAALVADAQLLSNKNNKVQIFTQTESIYSRFCSKCALLENHFDHFCKLSGYISSGNLNDYPIIRQQITGVETCIVIGSGSGSLENLINSSASGRTKHRVALVDSKARLSDEYSILNVGYARHSTDKTVFAKLKSQQSLSIGEAKGNIADIEHLLRDSRFGAINVDLVGESIIGFSIFELCSIARYFGYCQNLDTLYIFSDSDNSEKVAELYALLVWYFIEGRQARNDDYPQNPANTRYVVYSISLDIEFEFVKSESTGRWWLKDPNSQTNFLSISFDEYAELCQDSIPNRIANLLDS